MPQRQEDYYYLSINQCPTGMVPSRKHGTSPTLHCEAMALVASQAWPHRTKRFAASSYLQKTSQKTWGHCFEPCLPWLTGQAYWLASSTVLPHHCWIDGNTFLTESLNNVATIWLLKRSDGALKEISLESFQETRPLISRMQASLEFG